MLATVPYMKFRLSICYTKAIHLKLVYKIRNFPVALHGYKTWLLALIKWIERIGEQKPEDLRTVSSGMEIRYSAERCFYFILITGQRVTTNRSYFILEILFINIKQLDALNFIISLFQASTCFEHMCSKHVEA